VAKGNENFENEPEVKTLRNKRRTKLGALSSIVSFTGELSPNPGMKNMISTYRKDFRFKK
jgi:hypothetical protein